MARPFITNIDEANAQLNALDTDVLNARAATTTATTRLNEATLALETERNAKTAAELRATTGEGKVTALEADLKAARNATVTGAAAPGVPPVSGAVTPPSEVVPQSAAPKLTGRAASVALMAKMQPK